jgi:aspartyl-tRNA(Asn)/glutamyl-tRNA(Gln) amidotransferase subunit A
MSAAAVLAGLGDATELAARAARGDHSAEALCELALAAAAADRCGAYAVVGADRARERARELDRLRARGGALGPLHGVPVAVKSNLCVQGAETNAGSRMLAGYAPPYDATAVARLHAAGAVVIGSTHMDEFGMGSTGENSALGTPHNPRGGAARRLTAGGSSSGSAAAVAAGLVPLALGSDTGGSVRQPAAFCGLFGLKPTWGRISRFGLIAFASSLDTVGVLARSARDLELALARLAGPDGRDATALATHFAPEPESNSGLAGRRIGTLPPAASTGLSPAVAEAHAAALERCRELGASVVEIDLPHAHHAVATYYVIATAEASSNLARFDGVRYGQRRDGDGSLPGMIAATRNAGFGDEVVRRIAMGTHVLSSGFYEAWFERAARVRRLVARDFERAFATVDLVALPSAPTEAFELGSVQDPLALYRGDALTLPASLAGLPAVSVPCPRPAGALPVGLQFVGPACGDARVLAAARAFAPHVVEATP